MNNNIIYHSIFTCNNCGKSLVLENTTERKEYTDNEYTKCREFYIRPCLCLIENMALKIKNAYYMTEKTSSFYKEEINWK